MAASRKELCELSLLDLGERSASSLDLKLGNTLRNPSGPQPIRANDGTIFRESRHNRARPDDDTPSIINARARLMMPRDTGLITTIETRSAAEIATAAKIARRLRVGIKLVAAVLNSRKANTATPMMLPIHAPRVPLDAMAAI